MLGDLRKALRERFVLRPVRAELERVLDRYPAQRLAADVARFVVFNQIPGDYAEFGVYRGDSLVEMGRSLRRYWDLYVGHGNQFGHAVDADFLARKRLFAFDSFSGLPSAGPHTPAHFSAPGTYSAPLEDLLRRVELADLANPVVPVPGWFDETLTDETRRVHDLQSVCAAFVDCDLYESAVPVFSFLRSLLGDGSVLLIDDWFRYRGNPRHGVQRALHECAESWPELRLSELGRCCGNRIAFVCHL